MWLVPTRGRPEGLQKFFDAAIKSGMTTPGYILLDENEKSNYLDVKLPKDWKTFIAFNKDDEPIQSMGKSIRCWFRDNPEIVSKMHWIGMLNDDMAPITPQWDTLLIESLKSYEIVSANDRWQAPKRMSGGLWSGDIIRAIGYLFPKTLCHSFFDDFWEGIAYHTGTWVTRMDVIIEHRHVIKHKVHDETSRYIETLFERDRKAWDSLVKNEMPEIIQMVKSKLRNKINEDFN